MTETQAMAVVAMIAARWPVPALALESQKLWARLLEDLDHATTEAVVTAAMQSQVERPDLATIRRLVGEAQAPDGFLPVSEAWAKVTAAFTKVGRYRPFPHGGLIGEAVAAIGWEVLCASENPEADRAHFFRIYGELLERARRQSAESPGAVPQLARRVYDPRPSIGETVDRTPRSIREIVDSITPRGGGTSKGES